MPESIHSGSEIPKDSELNKMASSGQEELFKADDVQIVVDQKHSTGN